MNRFKKILQYTVWPKYSAKPISSNPFNGFFNCYSPYDLFIFSAGTEICPATSAGNSPLREICSVTSAGNPSLQEICPVTSADNASLQEICSVTSADNPPLREICSVTSADNPSLQEICSVTSAGNPSLQEICSVTSADNASLQEICPVTSAGNASLREICSVTSADNPSLQEICSVTSADNSTGMIKKLFNLPKDPSELFKKLLLLQVPPLIRGIAFFCLQILLSRIKQGAQYQQHSKATHFNYCDKRIQPFVFCRPP